MAQLAPLQQGDINQCQTNSPFAYQKPGRVKGHSMSMFWSVEVRRERPRSGKGGLPGAALEGGPWKPRGNMGTWGTKGTSVMLGPPHIIGLKGIRITWRLVKALVAGLHPAVSDAGGLGWSLNGQSKLSLFPQLALTSLSTKENRGWEEPQRSLILIQLNTWLWKLYMQTSI